MGLDKLNKIAFGYTKAISDKGTVKPGSAEELEKRRKELLKKELTEDADDESEESAAEQKEEDKLGVEMHDRSKRKPKKA